MPVSHACSISLMAKIGSEVIRVQATAQSALVILSIDDVNITGTKKKDSDTEGNGPSAQNLTNGWGQTNFFFSANCNSFDFSIDEPGLMDQLTLRTPLDLGFGGHSFSSTTRGQVFGIDLQYGF